MKNKSKILVAAAVAGLLAGSSLPAAFAGDAAPAKTDEGNKDSCSGKDGCKGKAAGTEAHGDHAEKASCKGEAK